VVEGYPHLPRHAKKIGVVRRIERRLAFVAIGNLAAVYRDRLVSATGIHRCVNCLRAVTQRRPGNDLWRQRKLLRSGDNFAVLIAEVRAVERSRGDQLNARGFVQRPRSFHSAAEALFAAPHSFNGQVLHTRHSALTVIKIGEPCDLPFALRQNTEPGVTDAGEVFVLARQSAVVGWVLDSPVIRNVAITVAALLEREKIERTAALARRCN
jgi:hypothetical protein